MSYDYINERHKEINQLNERITELESKLREAQEIEDMLRLAQIEYLDVINRKVCNCIVDYVEGMWTLNQEESLNHYVVVERYQTLHAALKSLVGKEG